jgi:hypothetical protein
MGTCRYSGKLEIIIVENTKDEMDNLISLWVSIGSWITLHLQGIEFGKRKED